MQNLMKKPLLRFLVLVCSESAAIGFVPILSTRRYDKQHRHRILLQRQRRDDPCRITYTADRSRPSRKHLSMPSTSPWTSTPSVNTPSSFLRHTWTNSIIFRISLRVYPRRRQQRLLSSQHKHYFISNDDDEDDSKKNYQILLQQQNQPQLDRSQPIDQKDVSEILNRLRRENRALREAISKLEAENEKLQKDFSTNRIVIETFEGEGRIRKARGDVFAIGARERESNIDEVNEEQTQQWCDELEDGACPIEPTITFAEALRDRAYWLVGLLVLQSLSGLLLARNEALLVNHPVIVYFLTMLVGAGGNAGNQASVRVIRGLALGTLNKETQAQFLTRELRMALGLTSILSIVGFVRAAVFHTPFPETLAITVSLAMIVFSSVCLGAVLPLVLQQLGVDPAHSSTTIQVVMDILGVVLAILVSSVLLESPFGHFLVSRLSRA